MEITHKEARRLIHQKLDNSKDPVDEHENLRDHLEACTECRNYFRSVNETESVLRQVMRKQWDVHPLPLQMDMIFAKGKTKNKFNELLTTRMALVSVALLMFAFLAWQAVTTGDTTLQQGLPALSLLPTPSTQYTATNTRRNDCQVIKYTIQAGDTLEDIARQFSVSKESILLANDLTGQSLDSIRELVIPLCEMTPIRTIYPPTFTITPVFEIITTTPG